MRHDFYSSAVPEPRSILGLPLRPLSMGHIILLNRIKSAFVVEGAPQTYEEIAIAALICSLTYQQGITAIHDPETPKFLRWLGRKITGEKELGVMLGWRKPRVIELPYVCQAFADYLKEHTRIPFYTYNEGDFKEIEAPAVQIVKVALLREMNFTDAELMDRSWALCLWDYVTLKAVKGEVQMPDENKLDDARAVADRLQALADSGKLNLGGRRRGA